jgi:hypothetical protein
MATTKQQRRFNGAKNVVAAHRRNSKTTTATAPAAPVAPVVPAATEQAEAIVVNLDASPVNAPAAPAEPAAAPEVPVVPEDPKATAEAPEVPEQKEPATPAAPAEPAAPAGFTVEQELSFIGMGLKTLLGVEQDIPTTPEDLLLLGLRTARQTLMGLLANEEVVAGIQAKKVELLNKAKALVPTAPAAAAEPAPAAAHCSEEDLRKMGMSLDDVYL